jgi:hypothetical protein
MTTFEDRIAPLFVRVGRAERGEAVLAERVKDARAGGALVVDSIELLTVQFPDVLMPDSSDGQWVLRPLVTHLRDPWDARRKTIMEIELPTIANAADVAVEDVRSIEAQRRSLPQRTETARRSHIVGGVVERPDRPESAARRVTGWRRFFEWFARFWRATPPSIDAIIHLNDIPKRIGKSAEDCRRLHQQHTELHNCASELQRLTRRLDALNKR